MRPFLPKPEGMEDESDSSDEEEKARPPPLARPVGQPKVDTSTAVRYKNRAMYRLFLRAYDLLSNPTEAVDYEALFADHESSLISPSSVKN